MMDINNLKFGDEIEYMVNADSVISRSLLQTHFSASLYYVNRS